MAKRKTAAKAQANVLKKFLSASQDYDSRASAFELKFVMQYLMNFGYYLIEHPGSFDELVSAIKKFQGMFGLKKDGIVGPKTVKAMLRPRCGHPDANENKNRMAMRLKEFRRANLDKWKATELRYFTKTRVKDLDATTIDKLIQKAFDQWTAVAGISAVPVTKASQAQIIIGTGQGSRSSFDGAGGTLAWAYMPEGDKFDGQLEVRFDLGETWITDPDDEGILFLNVATHEFGHILGLDHSKKSTALMAPYYDPGVVGPQKIDDVPRIQQLYGPPKGTVVPTPAPTPAPKPGKGEVITITLTPGSVVESIKRS